MERQHQYVKPVSFLKNALLCLIYAASLLWVLWWLISFEAPKRYLATKYLARIDVHIRSRFFRTDDDYGSVLLYQSAPFILVALLSFAVVELRKKCEMQGALKKRSKKREEPAGVKIRTYPMIVRSPMGVLTMADILFIAAILSLVSYNFARTTYLRSKEIDLRFKLQPAHFKIPLKWAKVASASFCMGQSAMIPFSLLWIPVSRGSPFLRLIRMPFEHAVKYHTWLAMLTLFMLTIHGFGYSICYLATHRAHKIITWETEGEKCSVVAGVVALIIGLTMWTTSLSIFRRRWYEIFFGVHHLYMLFFLFWLYHVVWTIHFFIIPVLLFMVDRFLRMLQSRHSVDVLSANILESGSLHLRIAARQDLNAQGLEYHALSSWYLRIPSLARLRKLQWHFFSITSTPMDGKDELSIVIKPFGKWTANLRDQLFKSSQVHDASAATSHRCPFSFKAGVEGPYGDESNFFLEYKVLILIGGGIGITPLLALLGDVLHRQRLGQTDLPSSIQLYHCVRKPEELCVLNSMDPNSIVPEYEKLGLSIRVFAYVTSHSLVNSSQKSSSVQSRHASINKEVLYSPVTLLKGPKPQGVSSISSKGESIWVASTIIASMVGFYVFWGLSNIFLVKKPESNFPNYNRAQLVVASMVLGTAVCGGMVVLAWWLHLKQHQHRCKHASPPLTSISSIDSEIASGSFLSSTSCASTQSPRLSSVSTLREVLTISDSMTSSHHQGFSRPTPMTNKPLATWVTVDRMENTSPLAAYGSPWNGSLQSGCRPHWNDIFSGLNKEYRGQNIGVLVSGPLSMQEDIAKQCRQHTMVFGREASSNVFHYHPISFDL